MLKKDNGITMIVLVVTILVLLILAGVTIAILGNSGILDNTNKAAGNTNESKAQEEVELAWNDLTLNYYEESANGEYIGGRLNYYTKEKLNIALDDAGEVLDINYDDSKNEFIIKYKSNSDNKTYDIIIPAGSSDGINYVENEDNEDSKTGDTTLASLVTPDNYGDYINYPIDLNNDGNLNNDWKVFYNDGTNVFIITSDYIVTSQAPTDIGITYNVSDTGNYSVHWGDLLYDGSSSIDSEIANKFKFGWLNSYKDSTYNNVKAVASLLDNSKWVSFIDSQYASYAIGSPTIEMFTSSWNAKYSDEKLYCNNSNSVGYYLGTITVPTSYGISSDTIKSYEGYTNSLYYPYTNIVNKCSGYWLASNSMNNSDSIFVVKADGSIVIDKVQEASFALRPVICIKENINATISDDNIWQLK